MASAGDTLGIMLEMGGEEPAGAPLGSGAGAVGPGVGGPELREEELEALKAVALDYIAWILGAVLGRWNSPKVAEVPALLRKYQRAEVELLRTALFKYVARSPIPNMLGFPPATAAQPHAPWAQQEAEYRRLLRCLRGSLRGTETWQEPIWPEGACSEWLMDSFFHQAWGLLELHIAELRSAAADGASVLLPQRDVGAAAREGAAAFAAAAAEPAAAPRRAGSLTRRELRAAWGLKYRRLFMAAGSSSSPGEGQAASSTLPLHAGWMEAFE